MVKSPYFKEDEFKCKCGCGMDVSDQLKKVVFEMREDAMVPFVINSGARCEEHNKRVEGRPNSAHTRGLAVDISYKSSQVAFEIEHQAHRHGITRIGRNYKFNFIHIDIDDSLPQRVSFEY